ncbi:hypothetical protein J3458_014324 [Metarhizium acridum]|uniref:uncharacterized protein n=1 Tax=Metarhizium acridum TaxID=92637 RepID=UPI001C6B7B8C|nr:hypothetical protein J3458_014324 [Metarhizium acridum]
MVQGRKGIRPAVASVWTRVGVKKVKCERGPRRQDEAAGDTESNSRSRMVFACRSVKWVMRNGAEMSTVMQRRKKKDKKAKEKSTKIGDMAKRSWRPKICNNIR